MEDENQNAFKEKFEVIHMSMFVTIVFFLAEVTCLVFSMKSQEDVWQEAEKLVSQPENIVHFLEDLSERESKPTAPLATRSKNLQMTYSELDWNLSYLAMRAEFINPRDSASNLPYDFNFADYLSVCVADELGE